MTAASGGQPPLSVCEVASRFESLGGGVCKASPRPYGCEFGFFQRRARFESVSLLRWASISPRGLLAALGERFARIADLDLLVMRKDGPKDWNAMQTSYGLYMAHTGLSYDLYSADQAAKSFCKTLSFLRDKLLEDLANAEKLLVYRTADETMPDEQLATLVRALRLYGPNTLLYVKLAEEADRAFTVERMSDGLLVGRLDRFAAVNDPAGHNDAGWEKVCRAALPLFQNPDTDGRESLQDLIDTRVELILKRHSLI